MSEAPIKGSGGGHAEKGEESEEGGSIMGSIAALRNILMIDTPTKSILNRSTSISLQQTRYLERQEYEEKIDALQTKLDDMKSDQKRLQEELKQEKSVNKSLQTTYDALLKHKKEVMVHLELLKNSRGKLEDDLTAHIKNLRETKREAAEADENNNKQIQSLTQEKSAALAKASDFESKYEASSKKASELEKNVASLKSEIEKLNQQHAKENEEHSNLLETSEESLKSTTAKLEATETMVRLIT